MKFKFSVKYFTIFYLSLLDIKENGMGRRISRALLRVLFVCVYLQFNIRLPSHAVARARRELYIHMGSR